MSKKYVNPPIVEVVCEIRTSPDSKWDLTIPGIIYEKLHKGFPNKEQRTFQEIELQKQDFGNIQQVLRTDERAMFFSDDRKAFVQIGNHLLAINHLKPYTSWNEFKPKIIEAFDAFKSTGINGLQRIGLRYINRIEVSEQQVVLDNYFSFRPYLGDIISKKLISSFIIGCLIPFSDGRDICKLQLSNVIPDKKDNNAFLLDIDYYLNQPLTVVVNDFFEWIELAHQNIEEMFEACITDQLRNLFEEIK